MGKQRKRGFWASLRARCRRKKRARYQGTPGMTPEANAELGVSILEALAADKQQKKRRK